MDKHAGQRHTKRTWKTPERSGRKTPAREHSGDKRHLTETRTGGPAHHADSQPAHQTELPLRPPRLSFRQYTSALSQVREFLPALHLEGSSTSLACGMACPL